MVTQYDRFRLWYNNGLWRFEGPGVHEVVAAPAGARVLRDPSVVVWHDHRHRDGESFVKRSEWYVELLQAALQRDPNDTRAMFYLARHLQGSRAAGLRPSRLMSVTWLRVGGMTNDGKRATTWRCAGGSWASGTMLAKRVSERWRLIRGGLRWRV